MQSTEYTLHANGIIRDRKNQEVKIDRIKNELQHINIAAEVESIGKNAFANCSALKTIEIPASVESIGVNAFCGKSLESVSFAEESKLKIIGLKEE